MRCWWVLVALMTAGCPWVGGKGYEERVLDVDGDGGIAVRFGGKDCQDDNPEIADCDADGDGFLIAAAGGQDCNDDDATVFPGADEVCDSQDNDCDGLVDNDDPDTVASGALFLDADADGFGDPDEGRACQEYAVPGDLSSGIFVTNSSDCDDADASISPNADERCDGFDNNCDGAVDDVGLWFVDADNDGFGQSGTQATGACDLTPGSGLAATDGDCDDADPDIYPGAPETPYDGINANCNDLPDDWDVDADGHVPDQWWSQAAAANGQRTTPWALVQGDCDDQNPARFVGNTEVCDGVDNDCDQAVDVDDLANAGPTDELTLRSQVQTLYVDLDGDGFHGSAVTLCPAQVDAAIHSTTNTDCFDGGAPPIGLENAVAAQVNQGADEQCDGFDNNCDGRIDHSLDPFPELTLHYFDNDADGFGDGQVYACGDDADVGIVGVGGDCNDAQEAVYPGAPEICGDAVRQDCSTAGIYDCDGDGFEGNYVGGGSGEDCDDVRAAVFPTNAAGAELCDGIDNDCDGLVDSADTDNLDAANEPLWFLDADEDGYGTGDDAIQQCDEPAGRVLLDGDCDDADATLSPASLWYVDNDGDGYGEPASSVASCLPPSAHHVRNGADCNDSDPSYNPDTEWMLDNDGDLRGDPTTLTTFCAPPPGQPWVLASNGVDCDDTEIAIQGSFTWYRDADSDGAGDPAEVIEDCVQPFVNGAFYVLAAGDCDDADAARHPQREEVCNGIDDDCDALIDDNDPTLGGVVNGPIGFRDDDGDGFGGDVPKAFCFVVPQGWSPLGGDCDDDEPAAYPGAPEICDNGIDDDCDGQQQIPSWYLDADEDGFGAGAVVVQDCAPPLPTGYASVTGDCDDDEPTTFPGAVELDACDAVDSDCDGEPEPRLTWYFDSDTDGFGADDTALTTCSPPNEPPHPGLTGDWVLQGGDCDDTDNTITFGRIWFRDRDGDSLGNDASTQFYCPQYDINGAELAVFLLDDVNGNGTFDDGDVQLTVFGNDCNDDNDQIGLPRTYFSDVDGDTWGKPGGQLLCPDDLGGPPAGKVDRSGDCRDDDPGIYPGADETDGDGVDSNCDGLDNNESGIVWYPDSDGDGFGDRTAVGTTTYVNPSVTNNVDCNDNDADVVNGIFVYTDADLDTFGAGAPRFVTRCAPVSGESLVATDCDDADFDRKPGVTEVCDGQDQDCDGLVDEELPTSFAYADIDGDGFGSGVATVEYCGTVVPTGASATDTDCDDLDPDRNPGVSEVCNGIDDNCDAAIDEGLPQLTSYYDGDSDGYGLTAAPYTGCDLPDRFVVFPGDCDDGAFAVNPGISETCNGVDDNCDGSVDEGVSTAGFHDRDGDGDGDSALPVGFCGAVPPVGISTASTDCDDLDPTRYLGAPEVCDGKDNDCDGSAEPLDRYYADLDGDGQGAGAFVLDCAAPAGSWSLTSNDCDDGDATVFVGASELCDGKDNDCSGLLDPNEADADGDGWRLCESDCDDTQALRHPQAAELCDGVADNDCDSGTSDPEVTDADADGITACYDPDDTDDTIPGSGVTWYLDDDGDGFGGAPSGVEGVGVLNDLDCDDTRADVHPGAPPVCEAGVDSDCNGTNDPPNASYLLDADGDGAGALTQALTTCVDPGPPWVPEDLFNLDCDDGNPAVRPGVAEVCNGIDDNCDALIDDGAAAPQLYVLDADADGHEIVGFGQLACSLPPGPWILESASLGADCDDIDPAVNTSATEVCDGKDNDCDDLVDEGVTTAYFLDRDGDGALPINPISRQDCVDPGAPWIAVATTLFADCDDDDANRSPVLTEVCDGIDNDCVGGVDDGLLNDWFVDADGDGFVTANAPSVSACAAPGAFGWLPGPVPLGDCNDADATINPSAAEVCDGVDNNCGGGTDEGLSLPWYLDSDGDGHGNAAVSVDACAPPGLGWVGLPDDCDDSTAAADPDYTGPELCDGIDNDCVGGVGPGEEDFDRDGYLACDPTTPDCDDFEARRNPGYAETCDGIPDNDCDVGTPDLDSLDGDLDGYSFCFDPDDLDPGVPGGGGSSDPFWYDDVDGDGYGDPSTGTQAATRPPGTVANGDDCNDANASIRPGVDELCNGVDDNCDGAVTGDGDPDITNPLTGTWIAGIEQELMLLDLDGNGLFSARYPMMGCNPSTATTVELNGTTVDMLVLGLHGQPQLWLFDDCDDGSNGTGFIYGPDPDGDGAVALEGPGDLQELGFLCGGGFPPFFTAAVDSRGWDCDASSGIGAFEVPNDATQYYTDDDFDGYFREAQPFECVRQLETNPNLFGGPDCNDADPGAQFSTNDPLVIRDQQDMDDALAYCFDATLQLDNQQGFALELDMNQVLGDYTILGQGADNCFYPSLDDRCLNVFGFSMGSFFTKVSFQDVGVFNTSGIIDLDATNGEVRFERSRVIDTELVATNNIALSLVDTRLEAVFETYTNGAIRWASAQPLHLTQVSAVGNGSIGSVFLNTSNAGLVDLHDVRADFFDFGIIAAATEVQGSIVHLEKMSRAVTAEDTQLSFDELSVVLDDNADPAFDLLQVQLSCTGCEVRGAGGTGGPALILDSSHGNFYGSYLHDLGGFADVIPGSSLYLEDVDLYGNDGPVATNGGLLTMVDVQVFPIGGPVFHQYDAGSQMFFDGLAIHGIFSPVFQGFELFGGTVEGLDLDTSNVQQPIAVDRGVIIQQDPVGIDIDGARFEGVANAVGLFFQARDFDDNTSVPIDVDMSDVELNDPSVPNSLIHIEDPGAHVRFQGLVVDSPAVANVSQVFTMNGGTLEASDVDVVGVRELFRTTMPSTPTVADFTNVDFAMAASSNPIMLDNFSGTSSVHVTLDGLTMAGTAATAVVVFGPNATLEMNDFDIDLQGPNANHGIQVINAVATLTDGRLATEDGFGLQATGGRVTGADLRLFSGRPASPTSWYLVENNAAQLTLQRSALVNVAATHGEALLRVGSTGVAAVDRVTFASKVNSIADNPLIDLFTGSLVMNQVMVSHDFFSAGAPYYALECQSAPSVSVDDSWFSYDGTVDPNCGTLGSMSDSNDTGFPNFDPDYYANNVQVGAFFGETAF